MSQHEPGRHQAADPGASSASEHVPPRDRNAAASPHESEPAPTSSTTRPTDHPSASIEVGVEDVGAFRPRGAGEAATERGASHLAAHGIAALVSDPQRYEPLARRYCDLMAVVSGGILIGIVLILLGLAAPAPTIPIVEFVRTYPAPAMFLGTLYAGASGLLFHVEYQGRWWWPFGRHTATAEADPPGVAPPPTRPPLLRGPRGASARSLLRGVTATSLACNVLLVALLTTHPAWCPAALCPSPQYIVVTNPRAVHDANLEAYLVAVQSSAYVLTRDPAAYTLTSLPSPTSDQPPPAAVPLGQQTDTTAYRIVIGVHDVQRDTPYSIILERVALIVDDVEVMPSPLNVWASGTPATYQGEPYQVIYHGQQQGETLLAALEAGGPGAQVQLKPGEADTLDLQVVGLAPAYLDFSVVVTYRLATDTQARPPLRLRQRFAVAFSDVHGWHPYQLQNGRLAASG